MSVTTIPIILSYYLLVLSISLEIAVSKLHVNMALEFCVITYFSYLREVQCKVKGLKVNNVVKCFLGNGKCLPGIQSKQSEMANSPYEMYQ